MYFVSHWHENEVFMFMVQKHNMHGVYRKWKHNFVSLSLSDGFYNLKRLLKFNIDLNNESLKVSTK